MAIKNISGTLNDSFSISENSDNPIKIVKDVDNKAYLLDARYGTKKLIPIDISDLNDVPTKPTTGNKILVDVNGVLEWQDKSSIDNLAATQVRRSTNYNLTTSYVDVIWDETITETDSSIIKHDTIDTSKIYVYKTGLYIISFAITIDCDSGEDLFEVRVYKNNTSEVVGSYRTISDDNEKVSVGNCFATILESGDYVTLQIKESNGNNVLLTSSNFNVISLSGAKGDKGDPGSGSTITLENGGIPVANTPHDTIDFDSDDFNVTDNNDGSATVTLKNQSNIIVYETSSESESSTTSHDWQQKLRLTTPSLLAGEKYKISWYYEYKHSENKSDFKGRVQINDSITIHEINKEPKDTDNFKDASGFYYYTISASGVLNIDIDYASEKSGKSSKIRRARLEVWRVS